LASEAFLTGAALVKHPAHRIGYRSLPRGRFPGAFSGEKVAMSILMAMTQAETNALLLGIVSLGFGVLILMVPRILNYVVALYLIVIGILFIIRAL
jgi:hypothetical protein